MNKILCIFFSFLFFSCSMSTLSDVSAMMFSIEVSEGTKDNKIKITWPKMSIYSYYMVLRCDSPYGEYHIINPKVYGDSFEDTDITPGYEYFYQVKGFNRYDVCLFTTETQFGYSGEKVFPPPRNLKITNLERLNALKIFWDPVIGATSYEIWRSLDGIIFKYLESTTQTEFLDKNLELNQQYYYTISSIDIEGMSSQTRSDPISSTAFYSKSCLRVFPGTDESKILVEWDPIDIATEYILYRSSYADALGEKIHTVSSGEVCFFEDTMVLPNKVYYYTLRVVVDKIFYYTYSAQSYLKTKGMLSSPTNVSASRDSEKHIKITWDPVIGDNLEYIVNKAVDPQGPWEEISRVSITEYADTATDQHYSYYYKIIPYNGNLGQESEIVKGSQIIAPIQFSATSYYADKIDLKWLPIPEAESYEIQYYDTNSSLYKTISTSLNSDTASFSHPQSLIQGEKRRAVQYRIRARVSGKDTPWSCNVTGALEIKGPVKNLLVKSNGSQTKAIQISWDNMDYVDKYEIEEAVLAHRGANPDNLTDQDFKFFQHVTNPNITIHYSTYPIRRYVYRIRAIDYSGTKGDTNKTSEVFRLPLDIDDFLKDVDSTIVHAQTQIANFGANGSSGEVCGLHTGKYCYKAGLSGSKNEWHNYCSFETTISGQPEIKVQIMNMSASMSGKLEISGLYHGFIEYNQLVAKEGGATTSGSITATYKSKSKTFTHSQAASLLQSVYLDNSKKPVKPNIFPGGGL